MSPILTLAAIAVLVIMVILLGIAVWLLRGRVDRLELAAIVLVGQDGSVVRLASADGRTELTLVGSRPLRRGSGPPAPMINPGAFDRRAKW